MKQSRWTQITALRALALALGLLLALTSCGLWAQEEQAPDVEPIASASATPAESPAVWVTFPGREDLQAAAVPVEQTPAMTEVLPAGSTVNDLVDLTVENGSFPNTGATVTFDLDQPLPEEASPAVVHWNEETAEWEPLASDLSADRTTLSADVEHFSKYGWIDYTFNLVNQLTGNYGDPPECPKKPEPAWSEVQYFDDLNGPLLWCVGTDEKNDDILEVRVVANRPTAMLVSTAVTPEWAWSSALGNTGPETWIAQALSGDLLEAGMTQRYLIPPKSEYRFGFAKDKLFEFWASGENSPVLIQADTSAATIVGGLAYNAVVDSAVADNADGMLAATTTIFSLVECGFGIAGTAKDPSVASAMGTTLSCLESRADDITRAAANHIAADQNLSWDQAKLKASAAGSKIRLAAGTYAIAKGQLAVSSVIGDATLAPIAFQLHFTPSLAAVPEAVGRSRQTGTLEELCGPSCTTTGESQVDHPTWGQVRIVTLLPKQVNSGPGYIAAVDDADKVLWSAKTDRMYELEPAATAQDATGNVFLNFNPGRHNGVIVLKPTPQGFDDLDTLPSDTYQKRFYHAAAVGEPEGKVVIWHFSTSCDPSCAEGATTKEQFRWNGSDYVSAGPPEEITTWPDEHYATVL